MAGKGSWGGKKIGKPESLEKRKKRWPRGATGIRQGRKHVGKGRHISKKGPKKRGRYRRRWKTQPSNPLTDPTYRGKKSPVRMKKGNVTNGNHRKGRGCGRADKNSRRQSEAGPEFKLPTATEYRGRGCHNTKKKKKRISASGLVLKLRKRGKTTPTGRAQQVRGQRGKEEGAQCRRPNFN